MPALLAHLRGNAVAYLALFVALSGTAYAATALPRNSVGTKQIKRNAVTGKKVKRNTLTGRHIREGRLAQVPLAARALLADNAANAANAANATKAADAATLGGQPPSAFLAAGATAANATTLGGQPASAFLAAAGKAADADKLDGIDSAVFGDTVTISAVNFEPRNPLGTTKDYGSQGTIQCSGASDDFHYRVELPQGAAITSVDFAAVDNAAGSMSLTLSEFDIYADSFATDDFVLVSSDGAAAGRRKFTGVVDPPRVVDNTRFSYQLIWSPFACGANNQLAGAQVHYTMPTG